MPRAAFLIALALAACAPSRGRDRGSGPADAPTCEELAAAVTERYARAGLVNGNRAALLAQLEVACPTWPPEVRACVASTVRGGGVYDVERCGVGQADLILPGDHGTRKLQRGQDPAH